MRMNPFLMADFYKIGHPFQYPKGTNLVYANLTPRNSRIKGVDKMVFFGLQYFIKHYLIKYFNENFFDLPKEEVMNSYRRRILTSLGSDLPYYDHIANLHDLGYLPIEIKALPEGSKVNMRVPVLTIKNTLPEFYWLTNFIETIMSDIVWQPCTSATIAHEYRKLLNKFGEETGMHPDFIQWQGHDFSFRGMSSFESAYTSAMGHLLSFTGTDTIPGIDALETYYNADANYELIGGSVNATEHSVMCAGEKDSEFETYRRLISDVYPKGIVSIVSDTWDLWFVLTEIIPQLKEAILNREGKVVIRPDSGDPVKILTGYFKNELTVIDGKYYRNTDVDAHDIDATKLTLKAGAKEIREAERKGVIELLWDVFGGSITNKGYKLLDEHIGAIYGDSITLTRAEEICQRLKDKGFASQVVLGIGSYTYQYNTRDTFGTAMKSTYVEVNGEGREIFKSPATDDGTKKSARGLLKVIKDENNEFVLVDQVSWEEEAQGELKTVFRDGELFVDHSLSEIRARLSEVVEVV